MSVKAKDLETYFKLNEQAAELEKKARAHRGEAKKIAERIRGGLEGLNHNTCVRGGYRATLEEKNGTVPWKEEFRNLAGEQKVAELMAAVPKTMRLVVTKEK